jgi:hypothetical protein
MTGFAQLPTRKHMEGIWRVFPSVKKAPASKPKTAATRKKDANGDYTPAKKPAQWRRASKRADGIAIRGKTKGRMV